MLAFPAGKKGDDKCFPLRFTHFDAD